MNNWGWRCRWFPVGPVTAPGGHDGVCVNLKHALEIRARGRPTNVGHPARTFYQGESGEELPRGESVTACESVGVARRWCPRWAGPSSHQAGPPRWQGLACRQCLFLCKRRVLRAEQHADAMREPYALLKGWKNCSMIRGPRARSSSGVRKASNRKSVIRLTLIRASNQPVVGVTPSRREVVSRTRHFRGETHLETGLWSNGRSRASA